MEVFLYKTLSPKYVNTLLLNTRAKLTISDSLICLVRRLSDCPCLWSFRDNLLAMSMDKLVISLLFVNARNAVMEYVGWDTILLSNISTSRISRVLQNRFSGYNQQIKLTKEKERGKYQYQQAEEQLRKIYHNQISLLLQRYSRDWISSHISMRY